MTTTATHAPIMWTRLANDVNGNPRFACHFLDLEPTRDYSLSLPTRYARVVAAANTVGGRKYRSKAMGGGVVFQAYECQLADIAARVRNSLGA